MSLKLTNKEFIDKAKEIHGNKYDYSLVEYINTKTKIKIICNNHGVFEQSPAHHIKGYECKKCSYEKRAQNRRISFNEFIKLTIPIHKNRYDYPDQVYTNCHTKIKINCKIHGEFLQTPYDHLKGSGCNKCNIKYSRGEKFISIWLTNNNIPFETQYRIFPNSIKGYKKICMWIFS